MEAMVKGKKKAIRSLKKQQADPTDKKAKTKRLQEQTRLRTDDDAMSVGCARFLREVAVRFWMVMMRPTRWDPVRYRRMYRSLYDRIQAGVMRHGERWAAVRILHMLIIRVEWMCAPIWSAGRVLRSHVGVKKARFKE
jgi:hypothetical protein